MLQASSPADVKTLDVWITDSGGSAVRGLVPEEAAVVENGVARTVTRLEEDRRPLMVAVIVDSSAPMATFYRLHLVDPIVQLLNQLPEGARFAVWTTGDRPQKIADWSDDVAAASRALKRTAPQGGNTVLDAIVEAAADLKEKEGERSAVVVVSGVGIGFTNWERRQVVEKARTGGATFMVVQFEETGEPSQATGEQVTRLDYDYVFDSLTRQTGGLRELTLSAMGVPRSLEHVAQALKAPYRLSYTTVPDLKERKVEVKVARPGVKVRTGPIRP
ncbi:MAG TPA: VWA domain-containing protein [Vicinamibacteria bacterium]